MKLGYLLSIKEIRVNQPSFINSKILKKIIRKIRLRKKVIDSKTNAARISYSKQHHHYVSLIWKEKKAYYSNLKIPGVMENKSIKSFKTWKRRRAKILIKKFLTKLGNYFAPKMSPYNFRNNNSFKRRRANFVWHVVLSRSKNMGFSTQWNARIWISQCFEIQNQKRWIPEECTCRICKIYFGQVRFLI